MKEVVIVGGPNGAGKTSWALKNLQQTLGIHEFVNADEIARGLSPLNPDGAAFIAGRLLIERIRALSAEGRDFAFETTCAGHGHMRLLQTCQEAGYRVTLIFLWLPSPAVALARVARRVREGGHNIPDNVVVQRYHAGLRNLRHLYLPIADIGLIYDNSDGTSVLIAESRRNSQHVIYDQSLWNQIEDATK
jgi:predicted ABC-type ATPase